MGASQSSGPVINFAAGPAKIPESVVKQASEALFNFKGTGVGVLSTSHRSKEVLEIVDNTKALIREILNVPDNYEILFKQAGGTGQFAAVPLNIIGRTGKADYVVTGTWSEKAIKEAEKFGDIHRVVPATKFYTGIPAEDQWDKRSDASYIYYCANETIHGIEYDFTPTPAEGVDLVADMSSNFLTRPIDVAKYGVIFAAAQKNIGPAGITVVIVRKDLLDHADVKCPSVLHYESLAKMNSISNTPPVFSLYVTGLVMEWIKAEGGLEEMEKRSIARSKRIYDIIDNSEGFYTNKIDSQFRSRTNVVFRIQDGNEELEKTFLEEAEKRRMRNLKGHRSVGGMRASLYNAITESEVEVLAKFMIAFQKEAMERQAKKTSE